MDLLEINMGMLEWNNRQIFGNNVLKPELKPNI